MYVHSSAMLSSEAAGPDGIRFSFSLFLTKSFFCEIRCCFAQWYAPPHRVECRRPCDQADTMADGRCLAFDEARKLGVTCKVRSSQIGPCEV